MILPFLFFLWLSLYLAELLQELNRIELIPLEQLMGEIVLGVVLPRLVEPVHVQLYYGTLTCLTNEVYFLCLKYFGRILSENNSTSRMMNPLPSSAQQIMF